MCRGSDNRLKSRVDGKSTQMGLRIDVNVEEKNPGGIMSRDCPRIDRAAVGVFVSGLGELAEDWPDDT